MRELFAALDLEPDFETVGEGRYPSRYQVTRLATVSIGAVGQAMAGLAQTLGLATDAAKVQVDQRLASLWFSQSIRPEGWELPPLWDAIAGDYRTRDGWIRLHTNLPHHRKPALEVLGCAAERDKVAEAVLSFDRDGLETAIVEAGGVAAAMRSREEWLAHPQGKSVSGEPLIDWRDGERVRSPDWKATAQRPLRGLKVLDLTRVLAGPVATRMLAGFGAQVLRIDPPGWEEANVVPDITLGKRCARLDLREPQGRETFEMLLREADVLVHGYRPDALENLGYGEDIRQELSPDLIEVMLDAYGWTGPWAKRRGFDSLVQMSSGIADAGMVWKNADHPVPLPVQALDHATGYLMAASVIRMLDRAMQGSPVSSARLSLARTAEQLVSYSQEETTVTDLSARPEDYQEPLENTPWGPAHRLKPPLAVSGLGFGWQLPASALGTSEPVWD